MDQKLLLQIEFHGIGGGQTLQDLQNAKTGIKSYLRATLPDNVDFAVTAITNDKELHIGGRVEEKFTGTPYVRIYHNCDSEATLALILQIIREYPGMYRYGTQLIRMDYTPVDRGGHLP